MLTLGRILLLFLVFVKKIKLGLIAKSCPDGQLMGSTSLLWATVRLRRAPDERKAKERIQR
ncbi:MAG: hypothetical protein C3F08_07570 [Candidatus Methylomirabilota bacterium]|nr:MAG: hypothetical protein C3F08_07570 [candidate division NC10 bacterium]